MNRSSLVAFLLLLAALPARAQDAPLPARVAALKMTLPPGFKATLFAGEPDVVQPIAFCFDDRGRLWVAECLSYPKWESDPKNGKDRIVIFEDTDGDGVHDKRTVVASNIANISGINYGFGGVWVCATPNLLFIPIQDDKPAGPPQIVLDGWDLKARHNVFNSLTWGPDGWLYGCNGILSNSKVGAPGTPDKDRVALNCGVWRYHPTKKKFEHVASGTTNPWGLDFDEFGEMFITNCVIDHLFHVVPGGRYQRMFGSDLNPNVYKLMPSICDHLHWGGGSWTSSRHPSSTGKRDGEESYKVHSAAGGGHAHVGCMIYLGDNWPDRYRGGVFMCNVHGNRINHDILERNGSTYVARHAKDFMHANDPWFRGLALQYGPDGGVYVSDWTDTGECHNYVVADKTNGRIFKITYGDAKPWKGDLAQASDLDLAKMQTSKNEWMVRHARRILQERAGQKAIDPKAIAYLQTALAGELNENRILPDSYRVRALWTLHAINKTDPAKLLKLFDDDEERIQAWGMRLLVEAHDLKINMSDAFTKLAKRGSPLVCLHLAGAAIMHRQRKAFDEPLAGAGYYLIRRKDHANDSYLPLMYWYATEPSFEVLPPIPEYIPLVTQLFARRRAELEGDHEAFYEMVAHMGGIDNPVFHRDVLRGIQEGLQGRRRLSMPATWIKTYPMLLESPLPEVRERAVALAVQFGDERAFTLLRKIVPDRTQPAKLREDALKTLLFQQKADLVPMLQDLLSDDHLRSPAIRGLAAYDHPDTPRLLLKSYAQWNADEKGDVIQTLSSRPKYALDLLQAIETKAVPRQDINSYTIRQWQSLKSPELTAKLAKVWGEIRPASADKVKLMAKYKNELKPAALKKANLANGRAIYAKACASCHRLFGEGGDIGPDLTGAQRSNLDYVLENVLDPSAIVPREFQVTIIATTTGRTLSGIVKKESDAALTLQTANEMIVIPKAEIEMRTPTKVSMMPEGALEQLRIEEVRDLVAYLASPTQVALKK